MANLFGAMVPLLVLLFLLSGRVDAHTAREGPPPDVLKAAAEEARTVQQKVTTGEMSVLKPIATAIVAHAKTFPEIVSVDIVLDETPNPPTQGTGPAFNNVVEVGWNGGSSTDLAKLAEDMHTFLGKLKAAVGSAVDTSAWVHVEVVEALPIGSDSTDHDTTRFRELLKGRSKHFERRRVRSGVTAAPTVVKGGKYWTQLCNPHDGDYGTMGGVLKNADGKYLVMSNDHVWPSNANCGTKKGIYYSARYEQVRSSAVPATEMSTFADPATVLHIRDATHLNDGAFDAALIQLPPGTNVDCRQGTGVEIKGVRDESSEAQWEQDRPAVWKTGGARTGPTAGVVVGVNLYHKDAQTWGYVIKGTWPTVPHDAWDRNPIHLRCPACTDAVANTREEGLSATPAWDPSTVFSAPGDSGSWVLDTNDKMACLLYGGHFTRHGTDSTFTDRTYCIPFKFLMDKINTKLVGGSAVSVCTETAQAVAA